MKKTIQLCLLSIAISHNLYSQSTTALNLQNNPQTRFLGYTNNYQLLFKTFDVNRMKINQTVNYPVNGVNAARNGYTLISPLQNAGLSNSTGLIYDDNRGAFSILHLNGFGIVQEFGARNWWKTGITLTDNSDAAYFGLRQVGSGIDVTETVINWTDNTAGGDFGPDDMVMRFTSGGFGTTTNDNTNYRSSVDLDGLHVARFTAGGFLGLGNTFGVNPVGTTTNYVRPQSLFHMSYDYQATVANEPFGFMQVTLRRPLTALNDSIGQGEAVTDGLRFGIDNDLFGAVNRRHLNSYLRWQEASSFVIQTEDGGVPNIQNNERLRVTSIGALDRNYTPNEYIGLRSATSPSDVTRISIAHSGFNGLTRPMSLLHLGYNIGSAFGATQFKNGWRSWMDLGMLVSNTTDNVWIGLKPRVGSATQSNDQLDAVINWGNNGNAPSGTDVMRFIFTAEPLSTLDSASNAVTQDGLEVMRLYPDRDTTSTLEGLTYGRVGIGDFTSQGVNEQPTHKLDVVGNGRFRALPDSLYIADSTVNKIVMVDSNGVLRWSTALPSGLACWDLNGNGIFDTITEDINGNLIADAADCQGPAGPSGPQGPAGSGVGAHNGTSISTLDNTKVAFGQDVSQILNPGQLLSHREVPMNDKDIYFTTPSANNTGRNRIGIGTITPVGKLHVVENSIDINTTGLRIENNATGTGTNAFGEDLVVNGANANNYGERVNVSGGILFNNGATYDVVAGDNAVGVTTDVKNGKVNNTAMRGYAFMDNNTVASSENTAFAGLSYGATVNYGGTFRAGNAGANYTAVRQEAVRAYTFGSSNQNFGLNAYAEGGTTNYAVFASVPGAAGGGGVGTPSGPNYAGFFSGDVYIAGTFGPSDQNLKDNITDLNNGMNIINQLQPKTFTYDQASYPSMNLSSGLQYGLIAQEVETVLPDLVSQNVQPAVYDENGNLVNAAVSFKGLEYQQLIPILIEGMQEQDAELDQKDSIIGLQQTTINDLNNRLTQLENCLSGILPMLCQMSQSIIESNTIAEQEAVRAQLSVQLSNRTSIVLDQNVPNPFAEQTVINFSIPATVQKAQIHFFDGLGKLIQSVDVVERGLGSLTVFGSDLSQGTYTYTLVADGQIVSTKKMMKQ